MTRAAKTRILADGWKATCFPPIDSRVSADVLPRLTSRGGWGGGKNGVEREHGRGLQKLDPPNRDQSVRPDRSERAAPNENSRPCGRGSGRRKAEGRSAGRQPLQQALRSARSPRVAPLSRSSVGEDGGSQRRWNQRFIQHGERSLGSASRSDYTGRRPIRCRGALTSP